MSDQLAQALSWLEEKRTCFLAHTITYLRGVVSVDVQATVGATHYELDDGAGAIIQSESRDYLILTADLVLGGTQTLPQQGDQVHETLNGVVIEYQVIGMGKEPCWRYSDPYRKTLRIHTKQI